jgi:hypothetical protein
MVLGAPDALVERISGLLEAYASLLSERIEATFVSEYRDESDQRIFEALWLFSAHFAMEAKLLGEGEDLFDFVPHKNAVRHVVIHKRNFDLKSGHADSRMSVRQL